MCMYYICVIYYILRCIYFECFIIELLEKYKNIFGQDKYTIRKTQVKNKFEEFISISF